MRRTLVALGALAAVSTAAHAVQLSCSRDRRTDAMQCVGQSEVRERDGIRYAPLYMGGPNEVTKTSFTIHTNCATGVTHLKDRAGVSFAGGTGNETRAVSELRGIICAAPLNAKKR